MGVVDDELDLYTGTLTEIGARVGVGPPPGLEDWTDPPAPMGAFWVPDPPTGAKGS